MDDDFESFGYYSDEDVVEEEDDAEETNQTIEKNEETPQCEFAFDKKEFIKYTQPVLVQLLSSSNTILRSV